MVNHMVEDLAGDGRGMDAVFHALAHDTRRAMLRRLAGGELTVGELAEPLAMSLAAASKHVQVLERAGLLHRTVRGRRHVCRLGPARSAGPRPGCAGTSRSGPSGSMPSRFSSADAGPGPETPHAP